MPEIICIANQKGGVGKTTTAVNLSAALALKGKKTLLIDLDPQGNATSGVGLEKIKKNTIYEVLINRVDINDSIQDTLLKNLKIIPSNENLVGIEVELVDDDNRYFYLKNALKNLKKDFDFIVIDCGPSLGILTLNGLCAADSLLIPLQCEYYALEGLSKLLKTYKLVKKLYNSKLELEGILLTMYDKRTKLSFLVYKEVRNIFPTKLFSTIIPRNIKLTEAPSFGKPVFLYDPKGKGALAYTNLAKELIRRRIN